MRGLGNYYLSGAMDLMQSMQQQQQLLEQAQRRRKAQQAQQTPQTPQDKKILPWPKTFIGRGAPGDMSTQPHGTPPGSETPITPEAPLPPPEEPKKASITPWLGIGGVLIVGGALAIAYILKKRRKELLGRRMKA